MRYLFLSLALLGCGSEHPSASTAPVKPVDTVPTTDTTATPAPIEPDIVSKDPAKIGYTMYITSAELPTCTLANVDQLVYVKDLKEFQVCDNLAWSVVDITGPAGKDGANGSQGSQGVAGTPGSIGPAGQVTMKPNNEWLDPITQKTWLVGSSGSYQTALAGCSSGWRLPVQAELIPASAHGLNTVGVTHPTDGWVTDSQVVDGRYIIDITTSILHSVIADSSSHGIYCVQ